MTFLEIQTSLAGMLGFESATDLLARDLADIKGWANAALLECYLPVAPHKARGEWTEDYFSDILKAPASATLGLTNGSTAVTGFAFEAKYVGSYVQIQDRYYRLGSVAAGPLYALSQPWDGDTGTYGATVYYNAVALPANVARIKDWPSLLGVGPLFPMPGPEAEVMLRSEPAVDFHAFNRRLSTNFRRQSFRQALTNDKGDPYLYFIDSGNMGATFTPSKRLHVYPIPDRLATIEARVNILPARMTGDSDVPKLPNEDNGVVDMVESILLPLAREKLVLNLNGRRFKGDVNGIRSEAERARALLSELARPQQVSGGVIRPARGW